jgi:hypothetical protein
MYYVVRSSAVAGMMIAVPILSAPRITNGAFS